MNLYIAICISLLCGFLAGNYTGMLAIRWGIRQKEGLQQMLAEAYHRNLLPEICRIEGLVICALNEFPPPFTKMFLEKALECVQEHKRKVQESLRKYHNW